MDTGLRARFFHFGVGGHCFTVFLASMPFALASDGISLHSMSIALLNFTFSFLLSAALCVSGALSGQSGQVQIITSDIGHFFEAYDRVSAEPDSAERVRIVQE
jgi:hypothetical protein